MTSNLAHQSSNFHNLNHVEFQNFSIHKIDMFIFCYILRLLYTESGKNDWNFCTTILLFIESIHMLSISEHIQANINLSFNWFISKIFLRLSYKVGPQVLNIVWFIQNVRNVVSGRSVWCISLLTRAEIG